MVHHGIQLTHMATSAAISLLSFYTLLKGKICKTTLLSSQQADKQKSPMSPAVCIWNSDKIFYLILNFFIFLAQVFVVSVMHPPVH